MLEWKGIDRRAHWLARNTSSTRPEAILFLDTEADIAQPNSRRQVHTFRLGVGCFCVYDAERGLHAEEWRDLGSVEELWDWVEELSGAHKKLLVIAHNLDYDSRIVRAFSELPRRGWSPVYFIAAQTCSLYDWECGKRKITLVDNMNWFNVTLRELGENVGLQKGEVDFGTVTDEELFIYCRRDVEILVAWWRHWLAFLDKHDLGSFGITIAKQAFNAYRHRFLKDEIGVHNHSTVMALERDAYHGGRVGCFRVGKLPPGTYYKLDVNSLYPAMMRWYPMPTKLIGYRNGVSLQCLRDLLREYCVIAEVVVETGKPRWVKSISGHNAYPTGSFFITLTTPELEQALADDEIRGVGRVAIYERGYLFAEYVDFFYGLREQYRRDGNVVGERICKSFLNALSGKFGQRGYVQKVLGDADVDEIWVKKFWDVDVGEPFTVYCFGGKIIEQRAKGEPYDNMPAIPAHICAYARLYMWSLIQQAGERNTFYIDTDCLIVNQAGRDRLAGVTDPFALGMMKLEGVAEDVEISARKDYKFGERRVLKGIKSNAVQLGEDCYEQWHFTTIKYGFRSRKLDRVDLFKVEKKIHYHATAGTVGEDGWVRPPHLHINPQDLFGYLADYEHDRRWRWEFDPAWLKRVEALEHLAERATYELSLLPQPAPSPRPRPLHLESLGAS